SVLIKLRQMAGPKSRFQSFRPSLLLSTYQLEFLKNLLPPLILGAMPQVDWPQNCPSICRAYNVKLSLKDCP
ncbi:hypothetical protein AVEN_2749-1, partial [Araneus ventricosus]